MVSELWYEILRTAEIPRDGTIIEFAPGFKSKVGRSLADYDFIGDYHLIEPNPKALEHSLAEYKRILPRATVYGHRKCLHELRIGKDIPRYADALLANHALDDMVLAMGTPREEVEEFFSKDSGSERVMRTRELWGAMVQADLERYASKTIKQIVSFLTRSCPQLTILSHYEGKTLTKNSIKAPNQIGSYVAQELQGILHARPEGLQRSMLERAGYGMDWVILDIRIKRTWEEDVRLARRVGPKNGRDAMILASSHFST
ncbi:TPA: hypothetical protein HA265_04390 [Candidatus Woesearchaeota archaeon]|nr:hypothetical protein [Candidatus Woesearchaeota archaeon]